MRALYAVWILPFVFYSASSDAAINVYRVDADSPCPAGESDGQSWSTAYVHLEEALAVAQAGDEVWVAEGTYRPGPQGETDPRRGTFTLKEAVAVYGGFSGTENVLTERDPVLHKTILDGDIGNDDSASGETGRENNTYHVLQLTNAASDMTRIEGFTISGGYAISPLQGNYVLGGGLYLEASHLVIAHCLFTGNAAQNMGGAIYAKDSALTLSDCSFTLNQSGGFGAGVAVYPDNTQTRTATLHVERCIFQNNQTNYALAAAHAEVQLSESMFTGNEGGGFCAVDRVTLCATNCVVTENGGMWGAAYIGTRSNAELIHCTLADNLTSEISVVSETFMNSTLEITNSVLWDDAWPVLDYDSAVSTVTIAYSLVKGGFPGTGNLDAAPRFCLSEPPCQPSWDSPAIDAGTNAGVVKDVLNLVRPQNHGYDMGAYEFGTDSDEGGLPDAYEDEYDLNSGDPSDDAVDSDGDGLDNREEFRRGSSPRDPNDPPSDYFVSALGNDETGDGSEPAPWRTINHAIASVPEGIETFLVTIHASAGIFEEKIALRPHTRLTGAGAQNTILRYYQAGDDVHSVVTAAQGSALRDCTVTFPAPVTATAELLRAENVAVEVDAVIFNGMDSPHAIAVFITGPGSSASVIRNSVIRRAEYGVFAVDSGVNVTRNTFEDLFEAGIFIRPPEGKQSSESETPLLGDAEAAAQTGFNRFRMSTGVFVKNMTANTAKAEYNDWGVYTGEAIAGRVVTSPGAVDYQPFLGQALLGMTIAVSVVDGTTGERIPESAHPMVTLSGAEVARDAASSLFLFTVEPGGYTCSASADGYSSASQAVQADLNGAVSVELALTRTAPEGEGAAEGVQEGEGEKENAVLGCYAGQRPSSNQRDWGMVVLLIAVLGLALGTTRNTGSG